MVVIKKIMKEWTMDMPWGKVAMVSWGSPANPPILMVHGYLDTCATFNLLVEQLPDSYYYISFDFPGHGKSDVFPPGPALSTLLYIEVVRAVVQHMKLEKFIYMGHSLAVIIGSFYNNIFPGKITKMIGLDPSPTLPFHYFMTHDTEFWAELFYGEYYKNYDRFVNDPPKLYTYDEALNAVAVTRHISKEHAKVMLTRCLVPVSKELYKLSWEPRVKRVATASISEETLFTIITTNPPPTLNINASKRNIEYTDVSEKFGKEMTQRIRNSVPIYIEITITGGHDVHITNPEDMVPYILDFLNRDFNLDKIKAKL